MHSPITTHLYIGPLLCSYYSKNDIPFFEVFVIFEVKNTVILCASLSFCRLM